MNARLKRLWTDERGFIGTTAALIMGGIAAAGNVAGSAIAAHGAKSAAKTQATAAQAAAAATNRATTQATDYLQQGRAQNNTGMQSGAMNSLYQFAGVPKPPPVAPRPTGQPLTAPQGQPAMVPQGGLVMLRAPNGQQKAVPATQVDHYVQLGATKVGG